MARETFEGKIDALTKAYGAILERYEEIERISREELELLRRAEGIDRVNDMLRRKRDLLRDVRAEEERVTGEREWWKKARRSLPAASGRALLSLLDAISRRVESTLELEAECRSLLETAVSWGRPRTGASPGAGTAAALAYSRGETGEASA